MSPHRSEAYIYNWEDSIDIDIYTNQHDFNKFTW